MNLQLAELETTHVIKINVTNDRSSSSRISTEKKQTSMGIVGLTIQRYDQLNPADRSTKHVKVVVELKLLYCCIESVLRFEKEQT